MTRWLWSLVCISAVSASLPALASHTVRLDQCIAGKCKNGRLHSVTVTADHFIVIIDPRRCGAQAYCPTSYERFATLDDQPARVEGYEPGKPTNDSFTVYVPRRYRSLHIYGINKSKRFATIDFTPFLQAASDVAEATDLIPDADTAVEAVEVDTQRLAVVVGIESYRHAPVARYASRDAQAFAALMMQRFGVARDRLLLLTDDRATKGEFDAALGPQGWVERQVTASSEVFVYFAGHGVVHDGRRWLLPHDVSPDYPQAGFDLSWLQQQLGALGAANTVLVLDAAFNGQTRDGQPLQDRDVPLERKTPCEATPGLWCLAAATGDESNQVLDRDHRGWFTHLVLRGLGGEADADRDGRLVPDELMGFVRAQSPTAGGQQTPQVAVPASGPGFLAVSTPR